MTGTLAVDVGPEGEVVITVRDGPAFYAMHLSPADARGLAEVLAAAADGLPKVVLPVMGGE